MTLKTKPERHRGKVAESAEDLTPMEKFKALARRLTKVSRQELDEQLRRHEASKRKRKK